MEDSILTLNNHNNKNKNKNNEIHNDNISKILTLRKKKHIKNMVKNTSNIKYNNNNELNIDISKLILPHKEQYQFEIKQCDNDTLTKINYLLSSSNIYEVKLGIHAFNVYIQYIYSNVEKDLFCVSKAEEIIDILLKFDIINKLAYVAKNNIYDNSIIYEITLSLYCLQNIIINIIESESKYKNKYKNINVHILESYIDITYNILKEHNTPDIIIIYIYSLLNNIINDESDNINIHKIKNIIIKSYIIDITIKNMLLKNQVVNNRNEIANNNVSYSLPSIECINNIYYFINTMIFDILSSNNYNESFLFKIYILPLNILKCIDDNVVQGCLFSIFAIINDVLCTNINNNNNNIITINNNKSPSKTSNNNIKYEYSSLITYMKSHEFYDTLIRIIKLYMEKEPIISIILSIFERILIYNNEKEPLVKYNIFYEDPTLIDNISYMVKYIMTNDKLIFRYLPNFSIIVSILHNLCINDMENIKFIVDDEDIFKFLICCSSYPDDRSLKLLSLQLISYIISKSNILYISPKKEDSMLRTLMMNISAEENLYSLYNILNAISSALDTLNGNTQSLTNIRDEMRRGGFEGEINRVMHIYLNKRVVKGNIRAIEEICRKLRDFICENEDEGKY